MRQRVWWIVASAALWAACSGEAGDAVEDPARVEDAAPDLERADVPDAAPDLYVVVEDVAPDLPVIAEDAAPDLAPDLGPEPEPLLPLAGPPRVQLDPAYPLPGTRVFSCRAEVSGAFELVWVRGGQEVGRGAALEATLGVGEAVTCEVRAGGAVVASASAVAARMGMIADLERRPASIYPRDPYWERGERHADAASPLRFSVWGALWRTDGSAAGTERELMTNDPYYEPHREFDDLYEAGDLGPALLMRRDDPHGTPALDLRAEGLRGFVRAVIPCLDGERCALVHRVNQLRISYEISLWRLARAGQPQQRLWSRDSWNGDEVRVVEQGEHRVIVATGGSGGAVVRVAPAVEERVIEGADHAVRVTSEQVGAGACLLVDEADGAAIHRVDAATGQTVRLASLMGAAYSAVLVEVREGCALLWWREQGAGFLWADPSGERRLNVPLFGPLWAGLDGLLALSTVGGERLYTLGADPPALVATPYGDAPASRVQQYVTERGRALGEARISGRADVYARDATSQWRALTRGLAESDFALLGVTGERAVFAGASGRLWAASLDGQRRSLIEPWETDSAAPFLPDRADGELARVVNGGGEAWAISGGALTALGHRVRDGQGWAAQRVDEVVMLSEQGDPLHLDAAGVVTVARDGIAPGLRLYEVFVWRDQIFGLAAADGGAEGRLYKLGAGARWVEHGALDQPASSLQLYMRVADRLVLAAQIADAPQAFELTAAGLEPLPEIPLALTPTRMLVAEYDSRHDDPPARCFLRDAAGRHAVDRRMCSWTAQADGERFISAFRLEYAGSPVTLLTIEPGARVAAERATLPELGWRARGLATTFDGTLYLRWWTLEGGEELWAWDEAGGMRPVADLWPGPNDSRPDSFSVIGGALYFIATSPQGRGIWRIDAPGEAPQLVHPPMARVVPTRLLGVQEDGALWFAAATPEYGEELWAVVP
jgi:ELWxxDGT repeat protein